MERKEEEKWRRESGRISRKIKNKERKVGRNDEGKRSKAGRKEYKIKGENEKQES